MARYTCVLAVMGVSACKSSPSSINSTINGKTAADPAPPEKHHPAGEIITTERMRDQYPVRLGIVALLGVGDSSPLLERSADDGVKLGPIGEKWIGDHCDVVALDSRCLTPESYPRIRKAHKLFTGLLYTYASSVYEQPHRGSVAVWRPEIANWELKTSSGAPVKHEDGGGHWMDCGDPEWQKCWGHQAQKLAFQFHADGVVAADMPPGNTFVGDDLLKYHRFSDKVDAASTFLSAVHQPSKFLVVPSGVGFDELVGRPTLPVERKRTEPRLKGRCWDEFDKLDDGAWAEGWVHPYWLNGTVNENEWEVQLEAADRAGRFGEVFIAALGYSTPEELEYGLASFLLVSHHQGRAVVQPMPLVKGEPPNSGTSLQVLMREYNKYKSLFDAPLGRGLRERRYITLQFGSVWRRTFANGDVYVNASATRYVTIDLGGPMVRATGETVRTIALGPHSGMILIKPAQNPKVASK